MKSEHKMLSDDLSDKLRELESEQRKRRDMERELIEYKQLRSKFEQVEEQIEHIVRQKTEAESSNTKHKNEIIELENMLNAKQKVIAEGDKKYEEALRNLSETERRGMRDDDKWQITQQYKDELESKQSIINELRIKDTDNVERIETLQGNLKKTRYDLEMEKERVNNFKQSKEKSEYELKEARKNLVDVENRFNDDKNESIKTEQQKNQAEIEIEDLRNQVNNIRKDKLRLDDDNCELRKQVEDMKLNISQQDSEISRLQSLHQTLERSKEDLIQKLQNTNKERNNNERDKSSMVTEISQLKQLIVQKESDVEEMRSSVIELDQRNDMLQSQLDYKTEELYETQNALESQNKDYTESKHKISIISGKEESYERRLQEREREIAHLNKQVKEFNKKMHEFHEMDNIKTHDTNQLANDVEILTKENQAVKEQLMKLSEEKEYFKIEFENTIGRSKQLQQNIRAVEIEKNDIQTSYKEVCCENQRLKESVKNMNYQNKDSGNMVQSLEREIRELQMGIKNMQEKEDQMMYDITQYDQNMTQLSQQYEQALSEIEEIRKDRDSLLNDHETQRNLSFNLEVTKEELHRHIMNLENERNIMGSKLDELRRDLDLQRERTEYERSRYYELEIILNKERIQMQHYEQERDSLRNENDILQSTNKKPHSYMLHSSLSDYGEQDSSMSMGSVRKSYDNRNKVNLQKVVSQLESEIAMEDKENTNQDNLI